MKNIDSIPSPEDTTADGVPAAQEVAEQITDTPSAPADAPALTPTLTPSTEELIAEAEQRGYLRGRNEALAERLHRPAMMAEPGVGSSVVQAADTQPTSNPPADDLSSRFLSRIRPSVWDL